jgi:hypothetical protein
MPACKGQAGKQEKMMKKIGLIVLLMAATMGTVFAEAGLFMSTYAGVNYLFQSCAVGSGKREGFLTLNKNSQNKWGNGSNLVSGTRGLTGLPEEMGFRLEDAKGNGDWLWGCYIKNDRYGYLDVEGAKNADGTKIIAYSPTKKDNQMFKFLDAGDGTFYIQSAIGNKYLQLSGIKDGSAVVLSSSKGGNNTKWRVFTSLSSITRAFSVFNEQVVYNGSVVKKGEEEKQKARVDMLVEGVGYLDNIAGALNDLGIAADVFGKVSKVTSPITKTVEIFNIYKDMKNAYDIAKQLKNSKNSAEKERLRMQLNMANLNWIKSGGGKVVNPIQDSLLEGAVLGVRNVVKIQYERGVYYDWVSTMGLYDGDLLKDDYKPYRNLGLQMYEEMLKDPQYKVRGGDEKAADDILIVFKALKAIDDAKKK